MYKAIKSNDSNLMLGSFLYLYQYSSFEVLDISLPSWLIKLTSISSNSLRSLLDLNFVKRASNSNPCFKYLINLTADAL